MSSVGQVTRKLTFHSLHIEKVISLGLQLLTTSEQEAFVTLFLLLSSAASKVHISEPFHLEYHAADSLALRTARLTHPLTLLVPVANVSKPAKNTQHVSFEITVSHVASFFKG